MLVGQDSFFDITATDKYVFEWDAQVYETNGLSSGDTIQGLNAATGSQRRYYLMKYGGVYVINDGSIFPKGIKPDIYYRRPMFSISPNYGCFTAPSALRVTWKPQSVSDRLWQTPKCNPGFTYNPASHKCENKPICDAVRETTNANGDCIFKPTYN